MAQSSEHKFGSKDPRVCCICTERVLITGDKALRFYHSPGVSLAWHVACEGPGWKHLHKDIDQEAV